jgi:HTH-type transcriptional regulator/antitoxin HigA
MTHRRIAEAFPAGDFIKEELEARNWSQVELAEIMGRQPSVINDLITGKKAISFEIARDLGEAFDTSAQYWMNLEITYQLWRTQNTDNTISRRAKLYQIAPVKEMVRRHWLEPSKDIEVLEKKVKQFFEIGSLDEPIDFLHAARKGTQEITSYHKAWFFRAKQLASAVDAKTYSGQSFENCLIQLKGLLLNTLDAKQVPRILSDAGIRFIVIEHLPHTKIDGVTFWLNKNSPVIVLSLRYDRIDGFWFTLAHELCHVKRRDGLTGQILLDNDLLGNQIAKQEPNEPEDQADLFATNFLIERSEINDFIARIQPLYGKKKIIGFARRIGIHPGIVVGQLQFRKEIPWSAHRKMLEKVRNIVIESALTDGWGHLPPYLEG